MKKALFASTALVAASVAGASFADVSLSGSAEMGLKGGSSIETQFHTDLDVSFKMSGDNGNGLTFGAKIDLDEVSTGIGGGNNKDVVWISGSFGTLTLGDTDGAMDRAMQEVGMGSALTDDHTSHGGYSGNSLVDSAGLFDAFTSSPFLSSFLSGLYNGEVLRYDYSFGDIALSASAEMDDSGLFDPLLGVGVAWSGDMGGTSIKVGLGYQGGDIAGSTLTGMGASVGVGMGGFEAVLNYSQYEWGPIDLTHMAIGIGYTMGDMLISANYGEMDYGAFSPNGLGDVTGYGVAFNYDLGGGAAAQVGYGVTDPAVGPSTNTFSAGLAFSF